ncbi:hypothetical protein [Streptomyces parvulus]|uniref:hypothetical protein n=1 Tax=Streptomyces parvulus TaxID=146923 RepID=UPI0033C1EF08
MGAGFVLVAVGMAWQSLLSADGTYWADVLPPSLLLGVALPLVSITTTIAATLDTREEEAGLASGLVNTSLQFGSVIGLAALSGVAATVTGASTEARGPALTDGFATALLVGAAPAVLAALLVPGLRLPTPGVADAPERRRTAP